MHSRFGVSFKVEALTNVWFYELEIYTNHYNRQYKAKFIPEMELMTILELLKSGLLHSMVMVNPIRYG